MYWLLPRMFRHAGFVLGTIIIAALSLGLAASTNAANPQGAISAAFDASTVF